MSSWSTPRIMDSIPDKELLAFIREVHTRLRGFASFTWDAPSVGANTTVDTTLTSATIPVLAGLRAGQSVTVTPPSGIDTGLMVTGWVPADDSLTIRIANITAAPINEASGTWTFSGVII